MKEKFIKIIEFIFGTKNNIQIKFGFSLLISGVLFFTFSIYFKDNENELIYKIFANFSGALFCLWLTVISDFNSLKEASIGLLRLLWFFFLLVHSLYFCLVTCVNYHGFKLILFSFLACAGIVLCFFYLVSKLVDIVIVIKNIFRKISEKFFESILPGNSKVKVLIENITAFFVSLASFAIAVKAIIAPLIELFN